MRVLGREVDPGLVDPLKVGERGRDHLGAGSTDHPADPDGGLVPHDLVAGVVDRPFEVCEGGLRRVVLDDGGLGREVDPGVVDVVPPPEGAFQIEGTGRAVHPGDLQFCFPPLFRHDSWFITVQVKYLPLPAKVFPIRAAPSSEPRNSACCVSSGPSSRCCAG